MVVEESRATFERTDAHTARVRTEINEQARLLRYSFSVWPITADPIAAVARVIRASLDEPLRPLPSSALPPPASFDNDGECCDILENILDYWSTTGGRDIHTGVDDDGKLIGYPSSRVWRRPHQSRSPTSECISCTSSLPDLSASCYSNVSFHTGSRLPNIHVNQRTTSFTWTHSILPSIIIIILVFIFTLKSTWTQGPALVLLDPEHG